MSNRLVRWGVYVLVAALFAVACAYLSHWQFDRNQEKAHQIQLVEENFDADPVSLAETIPADGALDPADQWRPVRLQGTYLPEDTVLARNRPHDGTVAFEVLVPFQNEDGRVLLINRGWVPPTEDSQPSPVPAPPSGEVTVIARLQPGEALPRSGRSAPEGQVPTINLPLISEHTGLEMITSAYGQMASEEPAAPALGGFDKPTEDPGPHLSYAIQWILFAVMGFIFIGYIIRTEVTKAKEDAEGRPPAPRGVAGTRTPTPRTRCSTRTSDGARGVIAEICRIADASPRGLRDVAEARVAAASGAGQSRSSTWLSERMLREPTVAAWWPPSKCTKRVPRSAAISRS
ncbi:SURF1 family protein [Microbacterium sp. KUDC0406]|nr:SURF1 family protein [Microbacterium sp. KUDC0406]